MRFFSLICLALARCDLVLAEPSGTYEGGVPFIIDINVAFNGDKTADFNINVKVAHQEVSCKAEAVAIVDNRVTFPNTANTGDCMGDALRGQKKDPSKYFLDVNPDGTLTFHSDGYPALKLKPKTSSSLLDSDPAGTYEGGVPFIIDINVAFNGDKTADFDINVKVAHQEVSCKAEAVAIADSRVTFPNTANTGDCMGDALRGQKKDPSKYFLDVNPDGTLTFHSDGYPALKLKPKKSSALSDYIVV